ncbi:MAG: hypothetical protein E6R14_07085 [Thermomicrobiales bacterium]|nr:MAG: hypothetical protein E6R14_07085 [Thermomicrobiales bacterium]
MEFDPFKLLSEATKRVPALKYVWAVVGVVAASNIAFSLSNDEPVRAVKGLLFVVAGVVLVAALVNALQDGATMRGPARLVVWTVTVLFVLTLVFGFSALVFGRPQAFAILLGVIPGDARNAAEQPTVSAPPMAAPTSTPPPEPVPVSQTFQLSESSNDCAANFTREIEFCLDPAAQVTGWSDPEVTSANCGSAIRNLRRSPTHPHCILVDAAVRGCGYDNFGFVRNCRGRGWVTGVIVVRGERGG